MKMVMCLALAVMTVLCFSGASAQSDCTNVLISMSPCLNYITGNSSNPTSQCCSQLASVVRSSPQCLCSVLNGGGSQLGLSVNQTQALALPGACRVQTPPVSSCNGGSSGGSPADSPTGSPNTSGTGSKTVPSTDGDSSSDGSSIKSSLSLLTFFFAAILITF